MRLQGSDLRIPLMYTVIKGLYRLCNETSILLYTNFIISVDYEKREVSKF